MPETGETWGSQFASPIVLGEVKVAEPVQELEIGAVQLPVWLINVRPPNQLLWISVPDGCWAAGAVQGTVAVAVWPAVTAAVVGEQVRPLEVAETLY